VSAKRDFDIHTSTSDSLPEAIQGHLSGSFFQIWIRLFVNQITKRKEANERQTSGLRPINMFCRFGDTNNMSSHFRFLGCGG
jgi:hypothetical protein